MGGHLTAGPLARSLHARHPLLGDGPRRNLDVCHHPDPLRVGPCAWRSHPCPRHPHPRPRRCPDLPRPGWAHACAEARPNCDASTECESRVCVSAASNYKPILVRLVVLLCCPCWYMPAPRNWPVGGGPPVGGGGPIWLMPPANICERMSGVPGRLGG